LSDEQAQTIKMNAITEWAALPATEMFLRDNRDDSDFSAFMSVWFFEEQKHSLVLMEYLRRFRPTWSRASELHEVRFEFDPAPALETLMLHFCGEIRLQPLVPARRRMAHRAGHQGDLRDPGARRGAPRRRLPALHEARDAEVRRRGQGRLRQGRRADGERAPHRAGAAPDQPARQRQAVPARHHPEPPARPEWLEQWLDKQIQFDAVWENKVVERILHNLSLLMERSFASVQELNRYRKESDGRRRGCGERRSEERAAGPGSATGLGFRSPELEVVLAALLGEVHRLVGVFHQAASSSP
jgi:hypothetical protein